MGKQQKFGKIEPEIKKIKINRKFRVITEIGSTFFGCWFTGQMKK
jgi:hypothetical protein